MPARSVISEMRDILHALGETKAAPKAPKKLDAEISRLYKVHGNGVPVDIFDLSKIYKAAELGYETGGMDGMEQAIKNALAQYRKN